MFWTLLFFWSLGAFPSYFTAFLETYPAEDFSNSEYRIWTVLWPLYYLVVLPVIVFVKLEELWDRWSDKWLVRKTNSLMRRLESMISSSIVSLMSRVYQETKK